MLALLNSLNAHNLPIFQPILMIFVLKFMVYRALSDKTYLSLGLLSPLTFWVPKPNYSDRTNVCRQTSLKSDCSPGDYLFAFW